MFVEDRWTSVRGSFGLAGGEVKIFSCVSMACGIGYFLTSFGLIIRYLFSNGLIFNSRNRYFVLIVPIGYEWSRMKRYDMRWASGVNWFLVPR